MTPGASSSRDADLAERIADFICRTASELPPDVRARLRECAAAEDNGSQAAFLLDTLERNIAAAPARKVPLCQDTGTLTFWADVPAGADPRPLVAAIRAATAEATRRGFLRQNTIEEPGGRSRADNLSGTHPVVHLSAWDRPETRLRLLMKGGGSENMSQQYSLPDSDLCAGRDLAGVRRCVLDTVWRAQGNGCAPGILGVCVGGDRATGYELAKEQLLRPLSDASPAPVLAELEATLLREANSLGIGPMGLGGRTTLLGLKICSASRLPASFFVTVAYICWACRRGTLTIEAYERLVEAER